MRKTFSLLIATLFAATAFAQRTAELKSPDGTIGVKVAVGKSITYTVSADNNALLTDCSLAMKVDGKTLGANPKLKGVKRSVINNTIRPVVPLKFSEIKNHCNVMTLNFGDYSVEFRAFDNGVAYRFVTSKKGMMNVEDETFTIHFPSDYKADISHDRNFRTSCESTWAHISTREWKPEDEMSYLPILIRTDKQYRVLISESDLRDYPGMFLHGTGDNGMTSVFPPCPLEQELSGDRSMKFTKTADYIARTNGKRAFPWRYFMIARNDKEIALNTLTVQLSSPCELADTEWIKPGQVSWDWWNHKMIWNVDFRSGINTPTYKYYIDFASKYGVPYIIMDEGWAKTTREPFETTKEIDLPELIRYGKSKNVGIILWLPWTTVDAHIDNIFAKYA